MLFRSKSVAEAQAFESGAMASAAWGSETNRAAVLVFDAAQPGKPKLHATGIRNCVALTVQPAKGDLWCTTNERDMLGDDLVPDYSTRVKEGQFYGWPWYYMGSHEDPRHAGARPDLAGKVSLPDVPYQAHSASVSLQFYTSTSGRSVFPKEYLGDGFAVLHGSWNREFRTGHKVLGSLVRAHHEGKPFDLRAALRDGRVEEEIHRGDLLGFRVVPLLPELPDARLHSGERGRGRGLAALQDRKSTRLNSSHT